MARIKLGPVVTDIAGSIGGATIQRNKFGYTMRSKPLPLYSETPAQYNIRRLIAFLQYSWQALTDAQRLQWNRFLDFSGQTIRRDRSILLSGQTLYIKYQLLRLITGRALLTTIAYSPMPDHSIFDYIEWDDPFLKLYLDDTIDTSSYFFLFRVTSPRYPSRKFSPRGLRYMETTFANLAEFPIQTPYLSAFGVAPSDGDTLHYSLQFFSMVAPVFTGVYTGTAVVQ